MSDAYAAATRDLRPAISSILDSFSLDSLIRKIPIVYQQYRLANWEAVGLFDRTNLSAVAERKIDSLELDTLLFAALSAIRDAYDGAQVVQRSGESISQKLLNQMRLVVAVDEASDFSAVELGCMALLAHPRFNSVTLSGDLMQQMTQHGIADWAELDLLLHKKPEVFDLNVSYRQSWKLLKIAGALWQKTFGTPPPFASAFADSSDEPDPLRFVGGGPAEQAAWIAERIVEVFEANAQRLPSIAVFVPSEDQVAPVRQALAAKLEAHNIPVEASHDGRILGNQAKVRVFNVEFIKGLEFEHGWLMRM